MTKVRFTKPYAVQAADGESYAEGQEVELSDESALHFVTRGVAEVVKPKANPKPKTEK